MNTLVEAAASMPLRLTLTWDLFIIVFVALVIAYSFIIGKEESATVIVATYVAIVAVESVGHLLAASGGVLTEPFARAGIPLDPPVIATVKLASLITVVILLATRGGLQITYERTLGSATNVALTALLGCAKAALLLTTLATSIAGLPLLSTTAASPHPLFVPLLQDSHLLALLLTYRDVWFALPAGILLITGILARQ